MSKEKQPGWGMRTYEKLREISDLGAIGLLTVGAVSALLGAAIGGPLIAAGMADYLGGVAADGIVKRKKK